MMTTKRVSPKKPTRRKSIATRNPLPTSSLAPPNGDREDRRRMVAAEAYYLAERRGFVQGHELEDWAAAELLVDSRLEELQPA
jgi:Protein of unknown function (DUF2934)